MERPEEPTRTEHLSFRASRALADRIDRIAAEDDRSRSYILREIVEVCLGLRSGPTVEIEEVES